MRLFLALVFLLSVALAGQGGGKPQVKKANVAGVDVAAPVTRSEAAAVFARARKAIVSARIARMDAKSSIAGDTKAVTREEVILEMSKILQASRKSMKFIPSLTRYNAGAFKVGSVPAKSALGTLVSWGFVAPMGALATGPKPGLSVAQFGDAVGFFLARMSDVTHMPSPKWSPYLQPIDDGE
jgi:hypothetical protein